MPWARHLVTVSRCIGFVAAAELSFFLSSLFVCVQAHESFEPQSRVGASQTRKAKEAKVMAKVGCTL